MWIDDASAEFLAHMVEARQGTHSLLLLNFRPEYRAEWMQSSWYRQIPLTPLDERFPLLAHHRESAGEALVSARWHKRAAEWSGRTNMTFSARHWTQLRSLVRALPGHREAASLGLAACRQGLDLSWRVGAGPDDSHALLREGQAFANALGDQRSHLIVAMAYSKAQGNELGIPRYIELVKENLRVAQEMNDSTMRANAHIYVVDSLGHGVRPAEALLLAERLLADERQDVPRDE